MSLALWQNPEIQTYANVRELENIKYAFNFTLFQYMIIIHKTNYLPRW